MLLLIHLQHLGGEVRGVAVAELLHGVHTGGLEQLGELRTDALDTEQVGMIDPSEHPAVVDAGGVFDGLAALRVATLLKELIDGLNADGDEFLSVHRADSLDVDNLVNHIKCVLRGCI